MLVIKAINFAAEKHKNQVRRETKLPYIIHPITVMHLLTKFKYSSKNIESLQCASILHDTIEDTNCSYIELEREFNPLIASIVIELTNDDKRIDEIGKNEYLKEKMLKMSKYSFIVKLVDRYANILDKPATKYLNDTKSLLIFLKTNRKDLTKKQLTIINEMEKLIKNKEGIL